MSYVSLIYNFKATAMTNFIQINLRVFEIYYETKGMFLLNTLYNNCLGNRSLPTNNTKICKACTLIFRLSVQMLETNYGCNIQHRICIQTISCIFLANQNTYIHNIQSKIKLQWSVTK